VGVFCFFSARCAVIQSSWVSCHINKLTESICLNKVQAFLELGIEATTETILFLGIIISMITRILAQMIESLCILQHHTGALGECQEFIQLLLHLSFRNIMCPEGSPKFLPRDKCPAGCMAQKLSHQMRAAPRSCWAAK
jgi:hypothetical protein